MLTQTMRRTPSCLGLDQRGTDPTSISRPRCAFTRVVVLSAPLEISGHLHCAVPNALLLEDVEGGSLSELNVLRHPIQVEDIFSSHLCARTRRHVRLGGAG